MELTKTEVLNPDLPGRTTQLAGAYTDAEPYPHVVIPDFFTAEFGRRLADDFPAFDQEIARNEMGNPGRKAVQSKVRDLSPAFEELDDLIQTPEFLDLISDITGIPDLLYDPDYTGGGTHENLDGQGLDPHVDFNYHPRNGWHRRLNLIVYLNPEWEEGWGGNFDLHENPWEPENDKVSTILPLFNQAVIFETSERSWHGFEPVALPEDKKHLSRRSFAIYLYTKDRPADETAASHATVYVPRPIPESVKPGEVLEHKDFRQIHQRFHQARNMLQFLYQREQRFNRQIDTLKKALAEARASHRLPLQGYAVQPTAPSGVWPDGWVGEEFRLQFSATKPVRGLRMEVLVPPQLEGPQVLEIAAGEWRDTRELDAGQRHVLELPLEAQARDSVTVTITARASWSPKADGTSGDDRSLAYRIVSAALEH